MKYLFYLLGLILFMNTCRTVDVMNEKREELLACREKDSLADIMNEAVVIDDQELTAIIPTVPFSNISGYHFSRNPWFVTHQ